MKRKFLDLELSEIIQAINKTDAPALFTINEKVMMPEADVLLCTYKNKRINIKVDFHYGASVEPLDKLDHNCISEIEDLIMRNIEIKNLK